MTHKISDECSIEPLQKEAFLGAAMHKGLKGIRNVIKGFGGKLGPESVATKVAPYGERAEQAVARGVGSVLGKPAETLTNKVIKGTSGEMARQMVGGALIGGALEGGLGAAMAEPGDRLQAGLQGLGRGAFYGTAFGGLGGAITQPLRNIRQSALTQEAMRQKMRGGTAAAAAKKRHETGFFQNLRDIRSGEGALGSRGAMMGAGGQVGQVAAELGIPLALFWPDEDEQPQQPVQPEQPKQPYQMQQLDSGTPAPPNAYYEYPSYATYGYPTNNYYAKTGSDQMRMPDNLPDPQLGGIRPINIPPPLIGSLTGAGVGGLSTGLATDYLKDLNFYPQGGKGKLLTRLIPLTGSLVGSATGYALGQRFQDNQQENLDQKLQQIDFDKLMRYYKKREPAPAPALAYTGE